MKFMHTPHGTYDGVVVRHYSTIDQAENAVRVLHNEGFTDEDISVVAQDVDRAEQVADNTGQDVAEGAGIGAATGGILGGIAGILVGATAVAIPGIGIVIAGPLAAALGGAGLGAAGGGLAGALAGLGVSEEDAAFYQDRLKAGDIIVAVSAGTREAEAERLLESHASAR